MSGAIGRAMFDVRMMRMFEHVCVSYVVSLAWFCWPGSKWGKLSRRQPQNAVSIYSVECRHANDPVTFIHRSKWSLACHKIEAKRAYVHEGGDWTFGALFTLLIIPPWSSSTSTSYCWDVLLILINTLIIRLHFQWLSFSNARLSTHGIKLLFPMTQPVVWALRPTTKTKKVH